MTRFRPRSLLTLGWLAVDETPDGLRPGGVAARAAIRAATAGHHVGIIGRVGQDADARALLGMLRDAGVDTSAVQQDPDLGTAVRRVRADGSADGRIDALPAAPDMLQWDFDMEDAARRADVVVFSVESWRSGQARSEERRLLDEAAAAVRAAELVHRTPSGRCDDPPRDHLQWALEVASVAVIDTPALARLAHEPSETLGDPARRWAAATRCARMHHALLLLPEADAGTPADGRWWVAGTDDSVDAPPRCVAIADGDPTAVLMNAALAMVIDPNADAVARALQTPGGIT